MSTGRPSTFSWQQILNYCISAQIFNVTFNWTTLFLSIGVPYWFYRQNRHRFASKNGNTNNAEDVNEDQERALLEEDWKSVIHPLTRVWKAHQVMIAIALA
jgi:hypothetical protein